jgi:hypothetical protein
MRRIPRHVARLLPVGAEGVVCPAGDLPKGYIRHTNLLPISCYFNHLPRKPQPATLA